MQSDNCEMALKELMFEFHLSCKESGPGQAGTSRSSQWGWKEPAVRLGVAADLQSPWGALFAEPADCFSSPDLTPTPEAPFMETDQCPHIEAIRESQ